MSVQVQVLDTPELGDRSYLVDDGAVAVAIDPQRDIDRMEALLAERGVRLALVVETHIHNDYVTGGYELARRHGAEYAVNADDPVRFERRPVRDGDVLTVGSLQVTALATPGHTFTHLSFRISDDADPDAAPAVFTGGSLLFGSVGRTDLVGSEHTHELTHAQLHSARRLAAELPDETPVYPTHGFGSFCSAGAATGGDESTMGAERERNDALTADDEQEFVDRLIANLTAYPAYYVHMAPMNLGGPGVPELAAPAPADPDEVAKRMTAGEWVVDLRSRTAFAADHVEGTISIELGEQFATFVGWLMPWEMPLTILAESADDVAAAQRQLVRIGIDHVAATATGDLDDTAAGLTRSSYPRVSFAEVPDRPAGEVILDVRRDDERRDTYIEGSAHVPLHSLLSRLDEVPSDRVWVHCASGFRAAIASSLLQRAGFAVVHIDDDFTNAAKAGLPVTEPIDH